MKLIIVFTHLAIYDHVILAGDFNCVLESKDVTGAKNFSLSLRNAVNNMGLCDSWEALRGNEMEYSYVTSGSFCEFRRMLSHHTCLKPYRIQVDVSVMSCFL